MSVYEQWQTVYDEYQNPEWFHDIVYDPFAAQFNSPLSKYRGYSGAGRFEADWSSYFPAFNERDWETLEATATMESRHLDESLELSVEQRGASRELEEEMLSKKRDLEVDRAETRLEAQTQTSNLSKENLRLTALENISQLDDMISRTGFSSSSYDRKRQLNLDTVTSALHQANFSKVLAAKDLTKIKERSQKDVDQALNLSDARYDANYNTNLQSIENQKEVIDLELMLNKMNVYEEWKVGHIDSVRRIFSEGVTQYDLEDDTDKQLYVYGRLEEQAKLTGDPRYINEDGSIAVRDFVRDQANDYLLQGYYDGYYDFDSGGKTCSELRAEGPGLLTSQTCGRAERAFERDMDLGSARTYCQNEGLTGSVDCEYTDYKAALSGTGQTLYDDHFSALTTDTEWSSFIDYRDDRVDGYFSGSLSIGPMYGCLEERDPNYDPSSLIHDPSECGQQWMYPGESD